MQVISLVVSASSIFHVNMYVQNLKYVNNIYMYGITFTCTYILVHVHAHRMQTTTIHSQILKFTEVYKHCQQHSIKIQS